jgi:hypothetical protein
MPSSRLLRSLSLKGCFFLCFWHWLSYHGTEFLEVKYPLLRISSVEFRSFYQQQRIALSFYEKLQLRLRLESCALSKTLAFAASLLSFSKLLSLSETHCSRDNPRRLSGLGLWRSDGHRKYLVRSRSPIFHKKVYILMTSLPRFWFFKFAAPRKPFISYKFQ